MVVTVDLLKVVEAKAQHPGSVIERLGNNISGGPITLDLKHMGATISIEGQEIDISAMAGPDLSSDDEQVDTAYARVLSQHLLKALFEIEWQRFQLA